jgi:phosphate:Na+ symporter
MASSIDWFSLTTGILGGLVFFLYGMDVLSNALKSGLGDYIRILITKFNSSNFKMMFTGMLVTVITQSTGATTVMLMSFVEANIMKFAETVPVILGACIGSSATSQIIAFDIAGYAIVPVIVGFFMKSSKKDSLRDTGSAIFGFGLVFFGMQFLGRSVSVLKDIPEFTNAIASADNPLLGLLVGTIGTCIMQSTGMFAGILMVFAKEGLIDIDQAYPLVIGSTIGTCLLIVIASVGGTTQSKRTMMAHVMTKCVGAFLFMLLMKPMVGAIEWFSEWVDCSPERQIANIHLFFNVGEAFTLLPFCGLFVKAIEQLVKPSKDNTKVKPAGHLRCINISIINVPTTVIESSISETATIIKLSGRMFDRVMDAIGTYTPDDIDAKRENQKILKKHPDKLATFKYLVSEVREYLLMVGRNGNAQSIIQQVYGIMSVLDQTERIADIVHRELIPLYEKLCRLDTTFSTEGNSEIRTFAWEISRYFDSVFNAFDQHDGKALSNVGISFETTKHTSEELRMSHIRRLWKEDPDVVATHEIHTELIDCLINITTTLSSIVDTCGKMNLLDYKTNGGNG